MALDIESVRAEAFKAALGSFPSGVTVITVRDGDGLPHGTTANAFSSVSLGPLLVLHAEVHGGTHAVFLGQAERIGTNDDDIEPLVYFGGRYHSLDQAASLAG